jgi:hypothetical protein
MDFIKAIGAAVGAGELAYKSFTIHTIHGEDPDDWSRLFYNDLLEKMNDPQFSEKERLQIWEAYGETFLGLTVVGD